MMGRKTLGSAVAVAMVAAMVPPYFEVSHAQGSCNREIARQDNALRRFANDAEREGMDFARDEVKEAALDVMKEKLKDNPTYEAYENFKTHGRNGRSSWRARASISFSRSSRRAWTHEAPAV